MTDQYRLIGDLGSPYSMKMRALMRYRRIPFVWVLRTESVAREIALVRPPVIPVLQYPDGSFHVDSTPLFYELEIRHRGQRSVIPDDQGLAFLSHLIEDMADEWMTKMMFIYRWWRGVDQRYCSYWLVQGSQHPIGEDDAKKLADMISDRQVSRMPLVGCTESTRPIIEESFLHIIDILNKHLEFSKYLFGSRPTLADFGIFGQLSQLNHDPTSLEIMREKAPRLCSWIARLDDASGEEEGKWISAEDSLPNAVMDLLTVTGDIYLPFLLANAKAFEAEEEMFSLTLLDKTYEQGTFKYQAKCLYWLREEYSMLSGNVKERVDGILKETGCWKALQS